MLRRAFTLVELMVAVVVLLAVIIATSKIFSTASRVTSMGEAASDVLQQAGVIEDQLRRDMQSVTQDGYIAIQCVAVRNDVNQVLNGSDPAPLLNPTLPPDAIIRADSIVFFKAGGETSMRWSGPNDTTTYGGSQQSRAVRVFYGHGVQLPALGNDPANSGSPAKPIIQGVTPLPAMGSSQILPWTWWSPASATPKQVRWVWGAVNNASSGMPRINPNQPGSQEWVLCRKATLLADDLGSDLYFPDPTIASNLGPSATPSIFGDRLVTSPANPDSVWRYLENRGRDFVPISSSIIPSPMMQSGWVDIASSELATIRKFIAPTLDLPVDGSGNPTIVFPPSGGPMQYGVYSATPPWIAQTGAPATFAFPPMGWPVGSDAAAWPSSSSVTSPSIGTSTTLAAFTSQRDRLGRGTFGPLHRNDVSVLGGNYLNVGLLGWPRAEKSVPNLDRRSEILVTPVLSNNCSSFQIDWTWERGTGRQTDAVGTMLGAFDHLQYGTGGTFGAAIMRGYEPDVTTWDSSINDFTRTARPQPWFGFPDTGDGGVVPLSWQRMGVTLGQDLAAMPNVADPGNGTNDANLHMRRVMQGIEGVAGNTNLPAISWPFGQNVPIRVYTAIFGFNQGEAYTVTPDGWRVLRDDYTPWPSQLRFTLTLHDPRLVLDRGREFQFVVDLPKRKK